MRGPDVRTLALTNGIFSEDLIRGKWGFICTPPRSTALKERNDCLSFSPSPLLFSSLSPSHSLVKHSRNTQERLHEDRVAALGHSFTIQNVQRDTHTHTDTQRTMTDGQRYLIWQSGNISVSDTHQILNTYATSFVLVWCIYNRLVLYIRRWASCY